MVLSTIAGKMCKTWCQIDLNDTGVVHSYNSLRKSSYVSEAAEGRLPGHSSLANTPLMESALRVFSG